MYNAVKNNKQNLSNTSVYRYQYILYLNANVLRIDVTSL